MIELRNGWQRLRTAIWEADADRLRFVNRIALAAVRALWTLVRDVREGQLSLRAMSLVYTTMLSLIPLLAISFSILKGFGVHEELEAALTQFLEPLGERGQEIADRIIEFVANVKAGVLGSIGLGLLVYTVISLMQKIERAFNFIWHVPQERAFVQRFSGYLSVIAVGPLLVFSSIGVSASLMNAEIVRAIAAIEPLGSAIRFVGTLVPYALVVAAFAFIYMFMPNTRVRLRSALVGALVAGLLWNATGWIFAAFVVTSAQYTAIYSAFAALIVFMLWLYVGWLILLVGSSIAFYHQHPEYLGPTRMTVKLSARMTERAALAFAALIVGAFRHGAPPPTTESLAHRVGVPPVLAVGLMQTLSQAGFFVAVDHKARGWLPAHPPEQIPVAGLLAVVRAEAENVRVSLARSRVPPSVAALTDDLDAAVETVLAGKTLADLDPEVAEGASDTAAQPTALSDARVRRREG